MVLSFFKLRKTYLRRRTRKAVLAELDQCIDRARGDPLLLVAALSQFLRRMALRDMPQAAAYTDERWLQYLDTRVAGEEFARGVGRVLLDAPYRALPSYDAPALIALVRRWTRQALQTEAAHV
jgi:hypothetical protein